VELRHTGQFLSVRLAQAWIRPFAPALPKGNEIASEEHPGTNTIAPVRVADDPGITSHKFKCAKY